MQESGARTTSEKNRSVLSSNSFKTKSNKIRGEGGKDNPYQVGGSQMGDEGKEESEERMRKILRVIGHPKRFSTNRGDKGSLAGQQRTH